MNISRRISLIIELRIGFSTYKAKYANRFFNTTAMMTITTIVPNTLMDPASVTICSFIHWYNLLSGQILNRLVIMVLPPVLKITCKNGASNTRENKPKMADKILKKKYKPTKPGYGLMY